LTPSLAPAYESSASILDIYCRARAEDGPISQW